MSDAPCRQQEESRPRNAPSRRRAAVIGVCCLFGTGLLTALAAGCVPGLRERLPRCFFHAVTGGWCVSCGGTRALALLARGRVIAALHMNALVVLAAGFVVYAGIAQLVFAAGGPALPLPRLTAKRVIVLGIVVLSFLILRNLPWFPFRLLAPS